MESGPNRVVSTTAGASDLRICCCEGSAFAARSPGGSSAEAAESVGAVGVAVGGGSGLVASAAMIAQEETNVISKNHEKLESKGC